MTSNVSGLDRLRDTHSTNDPGCFFVCVCVCDCVFARSALQAVFTQTLLKFAWLVGSALTMAICRVLHVTYLRQDWPQHFQRLSGLAYSVLWFCKIKFPSQRLQTFTFCLLCPKPTVYKKLQKFKFLGGNNEFTKCTKPLFYSVLWFCKLDFPQQRLQKFTKFTFFASLSWITSLQKFTRFTVGRWQRWLCILPRLCVNSHFPTFVWRNLPNCEFLWQGMRNSHSATFVWKTYQRLQVFAS